MAQYDFYGVFLPVFAAFARSRYNKISLFLTGVFSHGRNRFPRAVEYLHKGEIDPPAIDPAKFQSADAADVASSEPAEPGREVRCPGLSEYRSRKENLELGIPVAEEKWAEVLAM